jgi:hypothetical protein
MVRPVEYNLEKQLTLMHFNATRGAMSSGLSLEACAEAVPMLAAERGELT